MSQEKFSIEMIKQYINGELSQRDNLFVEQQLAQDEQWRDVYEGLVYAQNQHIDTEKLVDQLAKTIPPAKQKAPIIQLPFSNRWFYAAASILGIAMVSFALIYFLNQTQYSSKHSEYAQHSNSDGFYPEDQIQIISGREKNRIVEQHFDESEINEISQSADSDSFKSPGFEQQAKVRKAEQFDAESVLAESNQEFKTQEKSTDYPEILGRYGYKELSKPTLLNTPRGASLSDEPIRQPIKTHALSTQQIAEIKKNYEPNFIARFPFSGTVKSQFLINPKGKVQDIRILSTPNKDMAEVVKELVEEKIDWSIPKNQKNEATYELVNLDVSFGNTISIDINFATN